MPVDQSPPPEGRPRRARRRPQDAFRHYGRAHPDRINALILVGMAVFLVVAYLARRLRLNPGGLATPGFPGTGVLALALAAAAGIDLLLLAAFARHDWATARGEYRARDARALVPPALRPFVWLVILPSLAGLAVLAARVARSGGPLAVDRRVDTPLVYRLHPFARAFRDLTQLGSPLGVVVLSACLAIGCLAIRRRRAALLSLVGAPLAGALTEYVLKPLVGRHKGPLYAFPSGHTTGAVAVAAVITLFLLPGGAFTQLPRPARLALAGLAAVLASALPLGLIVLRYHYATDVLAGAAVAVTVTLVLALALDGAAART